MLARKTRGSGGIGIFLCPQRDLPQSRSCFAIVDGRARARIGRTSNQCADVVVEAGEALTVPFERPEKLAEHGPGARSDEAVTVVDYPLPLNVRVLPDISLVTQIVVGCRQTCLHDTRASYCDLPPRHC